MQKSKLSCLRQAVVTLILCFAVVYALILYFGLLIEQMHGSLDGETIHAGKPGVLFTLFATAIVGASLVRTLHKLLGRPEVIIITISTIFGVVEDSGYVFFDTGLFPALPGILATLSVLVAGVLIGCFIPRRVEVRWLWMPLGIASAALIAGHLMF